MSYYTWKYPDIPEDVAPLLLELKDSLVIVGVIGRSNCPLANKMLAFDMEPEDSHEPADGQIQCYYKPGTKTLLVHFETTYDEAVMSERLLEQTSIDFDSFYEQMRGRFVRLMLLALHVCHIIVYVETAQTFDMALLTIFQLLKYVREQHVLEFLPQMLRDTEAGKLLKDGDRLCTPRVLFLFENYPVDEENTRECISAIEFKTEDSIYEMLLQYNIVTNSASNSLLALPNNKQFVFYHAHEELRPDHLLTSLEMMQTTMYKPEASEEDDDFDILSLAPFEGFVKPFSPSYEEHESKEIAYMENHNIWQFLKRHVQDALEGSFDEGSFKQPSPSSQFQLLSIKNWHICMDTIHKLLIGNVQDVGYVATNANYQSYLRDFDESVNFERRFWGHLCELGLKKGIAAYKHAAPAVYGSATHNKLIAEASLAFEDGGRGPYVALALTKLSDVCRRYWQDGRQQCELPSLRGFPCTLPKNVPHDKHNSGVVHISSCNCGRMVGRREDPFTLRQANYGFYEHMAAMCNLCVMAKVFQFPLFVPSISDYRAAAFDAAFPLLLQAAKNRTEPAAQVEGSVLEADVNAADEPYSQPVNEAESQKLPLSLTNACSQPMSATYNSELSMSITGFGDSLPEGQIEVGAETGAVAESEAESLDVSSQCCGSDLSSTSSDTSSESTENELVLERKKRSDPNTLTAAAREISSATLPHGTQPELVSTTEYLPGLVHTCSGKDLLPLFPSWSIACVGPSSIYSHSTGLQEHFQSGFLSGANFLLPWDVHVRLVQPQHKHPPQQQQLHGKKPQRYRKHGDRLSLKIFVGYEYECSAGHRFMMCSPERVLRGGADIERDTSSKVVHNDMPLYFPCPCRGQHTYLAQLMRIHVVTPKAPINVIVDPKVRVDKYTFTLGCSILPRLAQSAYWVLRLPYVYQGDNVLIAPPEKLEKDNMMGGGCILAGMFSIEETKGTDSNDPITFARF